MLLSLLVVSICISLFLFHTNNTTKDRLNQTKSALEEVSSQLNHANGLDQYDSLLVEGNYEQVVQSIQRETGGVLHGGDLGLDLRLTLAERLWKFENEIKQFDARILDTTLTMNAQDSLALVKGYGHKLDSVSYLLTKAKVEVKHLKKQLYHRSNGEYLTFTNAKGTHVHYVGQVKNGQANGQGTAILSTGSRYVGEWKDNQRHGKGTYYWKDGAYYQGAYKNDFREGHGAYYWPNGEKFVGRWKQDARTGEGVFYGKDSSIMASGVWEADKLIKDDSKSRR